jgi:hypothetical protein
MTDRRQRGLRQPLLGVGGFIVTIGSSLAFCALFTPATLGSWVALVFIGAVPAMVVLDLGLRLEFPGFLKRASQPAKGLAFVALSALVSAVVSPLVLYGVAGGVTPPNPFAILFLVQTVPVTLVLVLAFRSWPVTLLSRRPGVVGVGTLVLAYALTWVIFRIFFDFGFLRGSPAYLPRLDPQGLFAAWQSAAFIVTAAGVLLCFALFDFWPLSHLGAKRPAIAREPLFGLLCGGIVLAVTLLVWGIPVGLAGMDPVVYLVRVPVAVIFGVFIVLTIFQGVGFGALAQPLKGVAMTAAVIVFAVAIQVLYEAAAKVITPGMRAGPPGYQLELWLATAMLGVTFPVIVVYCDAFGFWPLQRRRSTSDRAAPTDGLYEGDRGTKETP